MKKRNMFLMLFTVLLTLVVLTACGDTSDTGGSGDGDDVVTLRFFNADGSANANWDNAVAEEITRQTGVRLELSAPMEGDETQDIALMVASGDFPDLIFAKGSLDILVDAGAVLRLDDLIEERGDHIRALYGDLLGRLRQTYDNPHIYHVGLDPVNAGVFETAGTAQIQMNVMRYLGFPTINTLDEFADALRTYRDSHPYIDGQETIPLMLLGSDWRWLITVGNPAGFALGYQDDGEWIINEETGEAMLKYLHPEFREYFRWLNGLYNEGLIYIGSFTQTHEDYLGHLSSGRVLAVLDQNWSIGQAQTVLREVEVDVDGTMEPGWRQFMPIGPTLRANTVPVAATRVSGFMGGMGISIAADSPHTDLAFDFLNWFASEEAQILTNWGIEGVHWEFNANGDREFLPEIAEDRHVNPDFSYDTGIGGYVYPFPAWGNAALDSGGQPISPDNFDQMIADFTDAQRTTLAAYGATVFVDLFTHPDVLGIPRHGQAWTLPIPTGSELHLISGQAESFTQQYITQAILVSVEEFDAAWDHVMQGLENLNIGVANEQMTQIVLERLALWEGRSLEDLRNELGH